jgi:ABC-2 type transport system permease protein
VFDLREAPEGSPLPEIRGTRLERLSAQRFRIVVDKRETSTAEVIREVVNRIAILISRSRTRYRGGRRPHLQENAALRKSEEHGRDPALRGVRADGVLNLLAYRARYFVGILTYFFNATVWYYIWRALFSEGGAERLGGFTFPQMLTYVATGWILRSFYFNEVDRDIANQVTEGRLAMQLIKPVDFQLLTLAGPARAFRGALRGRSRSSSSSCSSSLRRPSRRPRLRLRGSSAPRGDAQLLRAHRDPHEIDIGFLRAKYLVLSCSLLIPPPFFPEWMRSVLAWLPFPHMNYTPGRLPRPVTDARRSCARDAGRVGRDPVPPGTAPWTTSQKRIVLQGG